MGLRFNRPDGGDIKLSGMLADVVMLVCDVPIVERHGYRMMDTDHVRLTKKEVEKIAAMMQIDLFAGDGDELDWGKLQVLNEWLITATDSDTMLFA